jgi:hypothetical protein
MNLGQDHERLVLTKIVAESMREIGVLVLIFVPLDLLLDWKSTAVFHYPPWLDGWLDWLTPQRLDLIIFTTIAIVMLYLGIKLETASTVGLDAEKGDNHK